MAASTKKSMSNKKRKLEDMSVDEFMMGDFDSDTEDDNVNMVTEPKVKKKNKLDSQKDVTKKKDNAAKSHKKSLENLKDKDPEFYEFLQQEGQDLLAFSGSDNEDESDDDSDENDDEDDLDDDIDDDKDSDDIDDDKDSDDIDFDDIPTSSDEDETEHRPPKKLEVASDYSSSEDEEGEEEGEAEEDREEKPKKNEKGLKGKLVTIKMIQHWSENVQKTPSLNVIKEMISAFKAAVHQTGGKSVSSKYRVEGSKVFNAVIRMNLSLMAPALQKHLGLPPLTDLQKPTLPSRNNPKWIKIKIDIKAYLTAVLQLVSEITETTMVNVILKHILKLVAYFVMFPRLTKILLKKMIALWSTAEETTRVLAFLCINRQCLISQDTMLEPCIKQMYIAYVKNCKFTSPTTLPMINFMQRSLVEILTIDTVLGYQYSFIYIRQLAIHLRNAITVKKKENVQAVYNWQYIHCLELWVKLLSASYPNEVLQPLIYPLTQTIVGTIKLTPTARYFPLRFHCVRIMNTLSESTNTFIPVLPYLLEVFELTDFNKKHKSISFKPFNFACILKLSKTQLQEKAFKDGIIDQLYELFMDHFIIHAHKIGFPELVLPAIIQLKEFLKKCKIANYCKQIKQILDKVQETVKFITDRRKTVSFSISDDKAITAWEHQCKNGGTPLSQYHQKWRKLRDRELQHEIALKEEGLSKAEENIPVIKRQKELPKATRAERIKFSALFDTDSEESDDELRFLLKEERPKTKKRKTEDSDSDYSDFDSDELEQLAKSASEDEGDSNDNEDENDDNSNEDDDNSDEEEEESLDDDDDNVDEKEDIVEDFNMSDSD